MRTVLLLFMASLTSLLASCTNHYHPSYLQRTGALASNSSALVAVPADGEFEQDDYSGSGRRVAQAVATAFGKHLPRVDVMPQQVSTSEQLAAARRGNFDYLIVPTLVHWEDRATQWSGLLDRIEIQVRILRANSGATASLGSVKGSSHWLTFVNQPPEQLLDAAVRQYVDNLFVAPGTDVPKPATR